MSPSRLLVVLLTILLFVLVGAIEDDYYDNYFIDPSNDTDATDNQSERYSGLAARLNCSRLAIHHKGIKIEEMRSNSISKGVSRVAPNQVKRVETEETNDGPRPTPPPPSPSNDFYLTLPPELFDRQENVSEGSLAPITDFDYHTFPNEFTQHLLNLTDDYDQQELNLTTPYQQKHHTTGPDNMNPGSPGIIGKNLKFLDYGVHNALINASIQLDNDSPKFDNSSRSSDEKKVPECVHAFDNDGSSFNWYEIIVRNGGLPGEVNATRLSPNISKVLEPCHRPITNTSPPFEDLLYQYELIEFEKVYRREKAFLRFAGTSSEFVDILGQLIWTPNEDRRYFRLSYRKDDTGFYVFIRRRHKCVFEKNPLTVRCHRVADFAPCANITDTRALSPGLIAALSG